MKSLNKNSELRYLWFFPIYLIGYIVVERVNIGADYHMIHCFIDDMIPFNELFVIAYLTWHILIAVVVYATYHNDRSVFVKLMRFLIIGTIICFAAFVIYPSCQDMRPVSFEHSNVFTWITKLVYFIDTPTNTTPSMHIVGSMGLLFAVHYSNNRMHLGTKAAFVIAVIIICASTLFLKQHSVIDIIAAVPVTYIAWAFSFGDYKLRFCNKTKLIFTKM